MQIFTGIRCDCILMAVFQIQNLDPKSPFFFPFFLPGNYTAVCIDHQSIIGHILHYGHIFFTCKIDGIDSAVQHQIKQSRTIHVGQLPDFFF